jgi:hypothetical protein
MPTSGVPPGNVSRRNFGGRGQRPLNAHPERKQDGSFDVTTWHEAGRLDEGRARIERLRLRDPGGDISI